MPLLNLRDLIAFPQNGDNTTDTVLNGIHFNKTALSYWNYTLYSNNTLSNNSNCYLVFDVYQPIFLSNGTFVNATSCYVPILPLQTRGRLGAIFASLFAVCIMFTLINLKKHGQQFLREDKRFRVVGRRWQWYWMLFAASCGIISCVTGVDVDRDYLQDLAIILQGFFFVLMGDGIVCCVWEGVRHWGSWQERQIVDRDPFSLRFDDRRGTIEFYLPLVFYFFSFMSFFLTVPRPWTAISKQHSIAQQATVAKPVATDIRYKIGGLFLCVSWFIIIYSLRHSIYYYKPQSRTRLGFLTSYIRNSPPKFILAIAVLAVRVGYGVAMAFVWDISLFKYDVRSWWPFTLGYTPVVIILIIFNIAGFMHSNEDKLIIKQRTQRGRAADLDMGLVQKPSWWTKGTGKAYASDMERLRGLVADTNIHGANPSARGADGVELTDLPSPRDAATSNDLGTQNTASGLRSRSRSRGRDSTPNVRSPATLSPAGSERPWMARQGSTHSTNTLASAMTGQTLTSQTARPQVVRSMLDV